MWTFRHWIPFHSSNGVYLLQHCPHTIKSTNKLISLAASAKLASNQCNHWKIRICCKHLKRFKFCLTLTRSALEASLNFRISSADLPSDHHFGIIQNRISFKLEQWIWLAACVQTILILRSSPGSKDNRHLEKVLRLENAVASSQLHWWPVNKERVRLKILIAHNLSFPFYSRGRPSINLPQACACASCGSVCLPPSSV